MKKILLGLFGLISLGLINFSSAGSYTFSGISSTSYNSSTSTSLGTANLFVIPIYSDLNNSIGEFSVSCTISNLNTDGIVFTVNNAGNGISVPFYYLTSTTEKADNTVYSSSVFSNGNYLFNYNTVGAIYGQHIRFYAYYVRPNSQGTVSFNYSCIISGDNILSFNGNDCSTVEGQLSTCQSSLETCQGNLTTCQNSPSTPTCSNGSCTVSNYNDIVYSGNKTLSANSTENIVDFGTAPNKTMCIKLTSSNMGSNNYVKLGFNGSANGVASDSQEFWYDQSGQTVCLYANKRYFNINNPKTTTPDISYEIYFLNDLLNESVPCEEVQGEECTQLKCENDYNLIPESSITSEYCEEVFNLIDPENCPASGGTGDVQWSAFFVNSHQIQGASDIYLWLPDFLDWDYTYIDNGSTLEINVENEGDQEYIQNILDIQSYHPDNDQFAVSFTGFLTLLMPYIIITLFIVFVWRLIRRIFK